MEASFDTWTSIFLLASAQGVFLSILHFKKKGGTNSFIGLIVLLFSITLVEYVFFWTNYRFVFPYLDGISVPFYFLYGPLIYLFTMRKVKQTQALPKSSIRHFIPFFICLFIILPYFFYDFETKIALMSGEDSFSSFQRVGFVVFPWAQMLSMIVYTWASIALIKKKIGTLSSLQNLKWIYLAFIGFSLSYVSYFIMLSFFGYIREYDYLISFFMSLLIYVIGYIGYVQPKSFEIQKINKYQNSNLSGSESEKLSQVLVHLMEEKKLFLNRELSLEILAIEANSTKHHLSQVLNNSLKKNFSDFVNEFRVEEAKKMLSQEELSMSMNGIANESGFNNRTSFNNSFKKYTNQTPTQFRKDLLS